jgi:Kef-type K+ transport system membrane component KefB
VAPFKGLLLGLFFLAVGMTADLNVLGERPLVVLALVAGLVALKLLVGLAVGRAAVGQAEPALARAVLLSQGGPGTGSTRTACAASGCGASCERRSTRRAR